MRRLSMIAVLAMQLAAACAREPKPADDKARSLPPCPDIAAMVNGRPVTTKQLRLFAEVAVRNDPRTGEHRADLYQNSLNDLVRRESEALIINDVDRLTEMVEEFRGH